MARFVLRYRGRGPRPDADVERIAAVVGVEVLDDTPRALLVDGPAEALRTTLAELGRWAMSPERPVPLPDLRRRPRSRARSSR